MGVDISGRKPTTEQGQYFRSNWWNWPPILVCCEAVNERKNLKFNTEFWGSNDGEGLKTQNQCNKLADALDEIAAVLTDNDCPFTIDGRFGVNLQYWNTPDGKFVDDATTKYLNETYNNLFIPPYVMVDDVKYTPSYATSVEHLRDFITFLRSCGGFKIW